MPAPQPAPSNPGIFVTIGAAFRQNQRACLLLNALVIVLVVTYYTVPSVAAVWNAVGGLKTRWSYAFSWASTVFAAVALPTFVQWLLGALPAVRRMKRVTLLTLFWGYRGMEIDLFYRVQTWLFGSGLDAGTLIKKVLLDQFVISPLWFVPTYVLALRWIDCGGSWCRTRPTLDRQFWWHTYPVVLITNWVIWIPTVALVYSLPPALQFPLFSVVMCFFILIVTIMARAPQRHVTPPSQT